MWDVSQHRQRNFLGTEQFAFIFPGSVALCTSIQSAPCPVYRHYNITASKNIRKLKYLPQQPCRRCTVPPTVWSKTAKASSFQRVQHHPSMSALSVVKNFIQDLRLVVKTSLQWTTTKQSTDCRISYLQTRDTTVN